MAPDGALDPFAQLADASDPVTQAWSAEQNRAARRVLSELPGRQAIRRAIERDIVAPASGPPEIRGREVFSCDRRPGHEQPVLVIRHLDRPGRSTVLFDPVDGFGDDRTATVDSFCPSPDGTLIALSVSTSGDENSVLHIYDRRAHRMLPERIPGTRSTSIAWWPDSSALAYACYPSNSTYGRTIREHRLGGEPADDRCVWPADADDPTAWPDVSISDDGRWYLVHVARGWSRTDVYLVDVATGSRRVVSASPAVANRFLICDDLLVGITTDASPYGRVVTAPVVNPTRPQWRTLVAESDVNIDQLSVLAGKIVTADSRDCVASIRVFGWDAQRRIATSCTNLEFDEVSSLVQAAPTPGRSTARRPVLATSAEAGFVVFAASTFSRPPQMFGYHPGAGINALDDTPAAVPPVTDRRQATAAGRTRRHRPTESLVGAGTGRTGAVDSPAIDRLQVTRHEFLSADGTQVPLLMVTHPDAAAGPLPTVLTGYGGFAITPGPAYSAFAARWCAMGGAYAVAGIRGGLERGDTWHTAGVRANKQRGFDDFLSAADWLVATGRTERRQLAVRGSSNGGLLVAAALTQRPDACAAVHCAVPLTDMLNYHNLSIARLWMPDYGDPEVPEERGWLARYSPYHHIRADVEYPAVLITTGEHDTRVDPAHARRFAAALQAGISRRPTLLRIEPAAGHGPGTAASVQAEELADVIAFLAAHTGLPVPTD